VKGSEEGDIVMSKGNDEEGNTKRSISRSELESSILELTDLQNNVKMS